MLDEALHGTLKTAEPVGLGLIQGLLVLPVIVANSVARQDGSSAIRTSSAVDEHRPTVAVLQNVQGLGNLLLRRSANALHRNADEAHSIRLDDQLLVGNRMLIQGTQIHHRLDPALGQLLEAAIAGLPAPQDLIVDQAEIRQRTLAGERRGCAQKRG